MQRLPAVGGTQLGEAAADFFIQPEEFRPDVVALAGQLVQGYGIGQFRGPSAFIEVESDPDDALAQKTFLEDVLDQDAADLAVGNPDVVGPFDAGFDPVAEQVVAEGEGGQLRDVNNVRSGHPTVSFKAVEDAESEVLARTGKPGMGPLTASRRLRDGCHD